jgi:VWFA-related protein
MGARPEEEQMKRRPVVAVVCSLAAILALSAIGQTPQSRETVQVMLVEVPVSVITKSGEPIRDLEVSDFELYDNGKKREVTNFDVIDFAKLAGTPAAGARGVPASARRNFLLLFDASNSNPATLLRARAAAGNFTSQLLAGDKVAVGIISIERGFNLLTGFTTDRALVKQAIDTFGDPKFYHPKDPLLLTASTFEADAKSVLESGAGKNSAAVADYLQSLAQSARRTDLAIQRQNVTRQLDAFTALGQTLDKVRGRKHVVLLSEGFDPRVLQGRGETGSAEAKEESQAVESGELWKVDTEQRYGNSAATSQLARMIQTLRRSDTVLDAIDIRGLRTDVDASQGLQRSSAVESLYLLTRDTGGEVFRNANDLSESFTRMLKQQEVTYILAFSAPTSSPGRFHDLKVKVRTPGAVVLNRTGYYEPSASTDDLSRVLSAGEIVVNQIPIDDVKVLALASPFPSDTAADVPVVLEINGTSLLQGAKEKTAGADILLYAFDDKDGLIRDFAQQRVTLDVGKVRDKLTTRGVKFYNTLRLAPGDYSIRALVRSGTAKEPRYGLAVTPLHVPSMQEKYVAMPLLFDDTSMWVMVKAPDRAGAAAYPFDVGGDTFVPAIAPSVHMGETKQFAVFAYNVSPTGVSVKATLAGNGSAQDVPVSFLGRAPSDPKGPIKLVYSIKAPATRGSYALTIALKPKEGVEQKAMIPVEVN